MKLELPEDFPINTHLALSLAGAAVSHPFQYAKVLMSSKLVASLDGLGFSNQHSQTPRL